MGMGGRKVSIRPLANAGREGPFSQTLKFDRRTAGGSPDSWNASLAPHCARDLKRALLRLPGNCRSLRPPSALLRDVCPLTKACVD